MQRVQKVLHSLRIHCALIVQIHTQIHHSLNTPSAFDPFRHAEGMIPFLNSLKAIHHRVLSVTRTPCPSHFFLTVYTSNQKATIPLSPTAIQVTKWVAMPK